jgi:hypothetical protein
MKAFFERLESGYQDGLPLHIASPDLSGFKVIPHAIFQNMPAKEVQELLRCRNVVVTGCPVPDLQFDEVGLRTLSPLDSAVSIQGKLCVPSLIHKLIPGRLHFTTSKSWPTQHSDNRMWPGERYPGECS